MTSDESNSATNIVCEFLHVAINSILFTCEIYPQGAFERKKKYGVPVQICNHPGVASYIDNVIETVRRMSDNGIVQQIIVVVLNSMDRSPVEKFVFEIARCGKPPSSVTFDELYILEQQLRATLLKIYIADGLLPALPSERTWTVEVHTKRSTLLAIQDKLLVNDMLWVMKDDCPSSAAVADSKIIPLKSISTEFLTMQLYVEELTR